MALLFACLASLWLAHRGAIARYDGPPRRGRVVVAIILAVGGVIATVFGLLLWVIPARARRRSHDP